MRLCVAERQSDCRVEAFPLRADFAGCIDRHDRRKALHAEERRRAVVRIERNVGERVPPRECRGGCARLADVDRNNQRAAMSPRPGFYQWKLDFTRLAPARKKIEKEDAASLI